MPAPKKPKLCPTPECQRPPLHRGKHGALTAKESALGDSAWLLYNEPSPAELRTERTKRAADREAAKNTRAIDGMAKKMADKVIKDRAKRQPIAEARKEIAAESATKEIAEALPKAARPACPACGRQFTARPSGILPAHKVDGQPCDQKAPPRARKPAAKKVPCVVSEADGCGRMIGVLPATGLVAKHIRTDGSPCPGSDLRPGSPLPVAKKRNVPPLNPETKPASRPLHDRTDRSAYHDTNPRLRSEQKAYALAGIVEQYGWENSMRYHDDTVELTMTRGAESIHIYWVAGVCAGEDITYTVEDREVKLRNASAVKMRAALAPEVAMAEVKQKMENWARIKREVKTHAANHLEVVANNRKNHAVELSGKLAVLHDEQVVKELQGKWVAWNNRISGGEEIGLLPRDPRRIEIVPSVLQDDRIVKFTDPDLGQFKAFRLSALMRLQTTAMRRRKANASATEE